MLTRLRSALHSVITTPAGDGLPPLRLGKDVARRINRVLGSPIASDDTLRKRRDAAARLAALRARPSDTTASASPALQAPVTVYHEGVRNARELGRIVELLESKGISFKKADVTGDEATMLFVTHTAGCEAGDLPVVFVGSACVGVFAALVAADLDGTLARRLASG